MKLLGIISVGSSKVISKHLSHSFPIQNGLKQGDALSPLFFNFEGPGKPGVTNK
jgi:hypothetical protein